MNAAEANPAPAFSSSPSFRLAAVLIVAATLLLPIWIVAFPPLLDYPNHLARAFVLAHLNDPEFSFRQFYRSDWGPYPYLGMDASLALLARHFRLRRRDACTSACVYSRCLRRLGFFFARRSRNRKPLFYGRC